MPRIVKGAGSQSEMAVDECNVHNFALTIWGTLPNQHRHGNLSLIAETVGLCDAIHRKAKKRGAVDSVT
jgi:hypothetical protein